MTPFDELKKTKPQSAAKAAKFFSTEAGLDVLKAMEDYHPARRLPKGHENLGMMTNGAVALLNHAAGYEELAHEYRSISEPLKDTTPEPPDTYAEDEMKAAMQLK